MDGREEWIGAKQWAQRAGISVQRARKLAQEGKLPARRVGRVWALDGDAARGYSKRSGRPLSGRSAWAVIDLLDGRSPEGVSRSERLRARRRVEALEKLKPGDLSGRALLRKFRAHPGVLERLDRDPRVVIGGARAARGHGADVISLGEHELYVSRRDLKGLIRSYSLRESGADANVKLRICDRLPIADGGVASAATAALDLLDAGDERSVRAARRMLRDSQKRAQAQ
jgi:hypothetical protein